MEAAPTIVTPELAGVWAAVMGSHMIFGSPIQLFIGYVSIVSVSATVIVVH
jgi:hypothetical protein